MDVEGRRYAPSGRCEYQQARGEEDEPPPPVSRGRNRLCSRWTAVAHTCGCDPGAGCRSRWMAGAHARGRHPGAVCRRSRLRARSLTAGPIPASHAGDRRVGVGICSTRNIRRWQAECPHRASGGSWVPGPPARRPGNRVSLAAGLDPRNPPTRPTTFSPSWGLNARTRSATRAVTERVVPHALSMQESTPTAWQARRTASGASPQAGGLR
jgi:hypothetical protein